MPTGRIPRVCAEQCPRQYACRASLPDARHAAEQQRMGQALRGGTYTQPTNDLRVPADICPVLRELLPLPFLNCGDRCCFFRACHYM